MSYCVNCGVELAPSEKECPLCNTPVVNPASPWTEPRAYPYPKRMEQIVSRIDRRYSASLGALILLIPALVSLLCDLLTTGGLTWSPYVLGALLIIFVFILVPWFIAKPRFALFLALDAAAALVYLLVISGATADYRWFLPLALPLTLLAALFTGSILFACLSARLRGLVRPAWILVTAAVACVLTELAIDLYLRGVFQPSWSLYAGVSALVIAGGLLLLERKQALKDKIRRRLFL